MLIFKGYIKHLEEKLKGRIVDFKFRDKSKVGDFKRVALIKRVMEV